MASRSIARSTTTTARAALRPSTRSSRVHIRPASSIAVPTSSSSASNQTHHDIKRDASLPNPDPAADSSTAALVHSHLPYTVATYVRPLPVMSKGEGVYLWDVENRRYLDFTAGIAVNSLGHADPELVKLIAQQSRTLMHCSNLYHNAWMGELSKLLVEKTREAGAMGGAARVFVCNSGSEANEAAIKFARKVGSIRGGGRGGGGGGAESGGGQKHEVVSFQGSFHGRTMGALSATPNRKYQAPFAPMLPGFKYGTFNDVGSLEGLITEKTCGVIVEPIQGEGGINVASEEFLLALRRRCNEVGAVLIYDEIQSGLGRTGEMWAHADMPKEAHPDIMTTAKALGNGFPVGATIVTEEVSNCIVTGDHGTTFGGNPLASRLAHYMVSRLSDKELQQGVKQKEKLFRKAFDELRELYPDIVTEARGKGLILGLQLTQDPTPIITAARERGLLVITAGTNTLRFLPPLIISEEEIAEGIAILKDAFKVVFDKGEDVEGTKGQQEMAPPGR